MSRYRLTKTRLATGVWEGVIRQAEGEAGGLPEIHVTHQGEEVPGVEITDEAEGRWAIRVPVPLAALSDGVQAFLITDGEGEVLDRFTVLAGEAMADDIRAEMELLRAELDMLKRAFRRHCVETMG